MCKIYKKILVFSWLAVFCVFLSLCSSSWAEKSLQYKTYDPKTGEITQTFSARIVNLSDGRQEVNWIIEEGSQLVEERYVFNADMQTETWYVKNSRGDADYSGVKRGEVLFLEGVFNGKKIEKSLHVEEFPFFVNPKFGLKEFVLSGEKTIRFWGLRNDDLSAHKMVASNKGEEVVSVNGQDVHAVRVEWTVAGFGSLFFKRRYWFRKSDGLYIRQEVDGGYIRELVDESNNSIINPLKRRRAL